MPTNDKKVQIYLKKFLTQQQMQDNFLEYLLNAARQNLATIYPFSGVFRGGAFSSAIADQFTLETPLKATDGQGHLLSLDPSEAIIPFQNTLGVDYFVGLRYNEIFQETETNVRTGKVEYTFFQERIGELAEPNSLVDNGSDLTFIVDSVAEVGVSNANRKVIVYKKRAEKLTDAFEEISVVWDGSNNKITTTTLLGQVAGSVSVDPADYQVFLIGPTVRRNTDLRTDLEIAFLGIATGAGAGNPPTIFDDSDKNLLFDSETFNELMDLEKSFLTDGGDITWDLTTETITWSADLKVRIPSRSFDYTLSATSIPSLADGDVLYFEADGVGGVRPVIKVANGAVPRTPIAEPILFRSGNNIYFRDGCLELIGDASSSTIGRIDGITQDLLTFVGATDESDADPNYSTTNYVSQGLGLTSQISALDAAMRIINNALNQNKTAKLIEGGVWNWDLPNDQLNFSADAFVQIAGLANVRNTIPTSSSPITLTDGDVAYIEINRDTGAASNRPIVVDAIANLAGKTNDNLFIIARRIGTDVFIGLNSFRLSPENNYLELDGELDEIHRFFSSLRLQEHPTNKKRVIITGADESLLDGSTLGQQISSLLMKFLGAEIDVEAGKVYEDDGTTDLGLDFVFPAIPFDEFHFFSVSIIPGVVDVSDNTISVQVLVIPGATSNAVLASAPRAAFGSGINLGQFYIQREANPLTSILPITQSNITQLGTGGGAGGGAGDASTALIRLEALLDESFYNFLEPNIFITDQSDKIDNTDGAFSFASNTFDLDAGEFLESIALLDPEFLTNLNDILIAQVALIYEKDNIDSTPLVELTPNGVLADKQTVTMERLSTDSDTYVGELIFDLSTLTPQILDENAVAEADAIIELEDTGTIQIGQEFTTDANTNVFEEIEVYLNKVGSPTGFVKINLHEDDAGDPGVIKSQILKNIADLSVGNNIVPVEIGRNILSASTKYHISVETDQEYKDGFVTSTTALAVRVDSSAPAVSDLKEFNGTIWAATVGSGMVYKLSGRKIDLRLKVTATDTSKLVGYGVYYGEEALNVQRLKRRAQFIFDGTIDNLNEFQLPWNADVDFLEVVDIFSGQTWEVPAFALEANKIVFEPGFFNGRDTVQLKAKQIDGGQFDSSPENANLLQDNFLGSNDPAIDRSVPGRGNKTRATDSGTTLVELTVDDEFNLVIKEA